MYKYLLIISAIMLSCNDGVKESDSDNKINSDLFNNDQSSENSNKNSNGPVVQFDKEQHNFGVISQGDVVSHNFIIKNLGKSDLIISSARGSCGCTVPDWPKDPIEPGSEANIKVTYNSKGKSGPDSRTVTVLTNAIPNTKVLTIKANVKK